MKRKTYKLIEKLTKPDVHKPRTKVFLDKSLSYLGSSLKKYVYGIEILDYKNNSCLRARILITRKSTLFIKKAHSLECSIIGLDLLKKIPKNMSHTINKLIIEYELDKREPSWILLLKPDGNHLFANLEG